MLTAVTKTDKQNGGITVNVAHFITPIGFYGAERWILALASKMGGARGRCELVITSENPEQRFEIFEQYPASAGGKYRLEMAGRFDVSIIGRLAELLVEQEIDVIQTHGYKSDIIGYLAARRAGIACISTPHGFGLHKNIKIRLFTYISTLFLKRFDRVVPLSEGLAGQVRKMGVEESRIRVIENAFDVDEIDAVIKASHNGRASKISRIGYVGQLISRKQIDQLISVFARLSAKEPDLELIIAGEGEQRDDLEAQANLLECRAKISFLGYVEDRLELMRTLDMFVMTSTSEGIPRSLMEAMAMSIPVVAYNIPGVDVLIEHDTTGLLAPLNDQDSLESNISSLVVNIGAAQRLGNNARMHVEKRFSASRMSDEYQALYIDLLNLG